MSQETVEVTLSELREYGAPGYGESNMDLLEKARQDVIDASILLVRLRDGLDHDESRLECLATTLLERAVTRIDLCHNELDLEQERSRAGTDG